ncbi:isocitrate lyase/PEP mutase family protein [Microbacterium sp. ASV49]|uniref:Isocitrate lyase/phosphoenolpyruvate mutase family protein n=1 Tax=Microbacterium candidum TaxID=3041922 RepID=A0ABT7MWU8_9MICO|nr:isocitrate lyase/phosphoenolpyruvate mutase family protein [Microbacterium sp. ASV49]MDL9978920.1 isocitrate lyase/phosphoenolpyruvate mutase family protein [Microbacterium sp. ASV49]
MSILEDPAYTVVPVPQATSGVAWLRAHVARFSEGEDHARRRTLAERLLATVDASSLRRPGAPTANLAAALGFPRNRALVADVALVGAAYQPYFVQSQEADDALARLVDRAGGRWDEETAARIALLVQSHHATNALIAGAHPPVPATRRISPKGEEVQVDLTATPFGAGRHACPGEDHARAMADGAQAFRRLHDGPAPLVLPNAWDAASAAAFASAGFAAIGTTSLGVAASQGLPDGEGLLLDETLALARRLATLPVPVTVDIEYGFGADLEELGAELSAMGIAGVNLEDGRGNGLADPAEQAELIRRLKADAPELFVNARVDTYWVGTAHDETLGRAQAYVDAGADGVFVPGLTDPTEIERIVAAVPVPLNLLAGLPIPQLTDLGVRRVSTGSLLFRSAITAAVDAARRVRDGGDLPETMPYDTVQGLSGAFR